MFPSCKRFETCGVNRMGEKNCPKNGFLKFCGRKLFFLAARSLFWALPEWNWMEKPLNVDRPKISLWTFLFVFFFRRFLLQTSQCSQVCYNWAISVGFVCQHTRKSVANPFEVREAFPKLSRSFQQPLQTEVAFLSLLRTETTLPRSDWGEQSHLRCTWGWGDAFEVRRKYFELISRPAKLLEHLLRREIPCKAYKCLFSVYFKSKEVSDANQ